MVILSPPKEKVAKRKSAAAENACGRERGERGSQRAPPTAA